jgi:hypothetical protein
MAKDDDLPPFVDALAPPEPFVDALAPGYKPPGSSAVRRYIGDPAISLAKGVVGVAEAPVGLADIVSGGAAGRLAERAGFDFKGVRQYLDSKLTPEQQAANRAVQEADGLLPVIKAVAQNPSVIPNAIIESAPLMIGGAALGRAGMALAPKVITPLRAGAMGEGALTAGMAAEQFRQQDPAGELSPKQAALAVGAGLATGLIGGAGGKVADYLKVGNPETILVGGRRVLAPGEQMPGVLRRVGGGAAVEAGEEVLQSTQEQVAQNLGTGQPWDDQLAQSAVLGGLAGGVMGAGFNAIPPRVAPTPPAPPAPPPEPPLALPAPTPVIGPDGGPIQTYLDQSRQAAADNAAAVQAARAAEETRLAGLGVPRPGAPAEPPAPAGTLTAAAQIATAATSGQAFPFASQEAAQARARAQSAETGQPHIVVPHPEQPGRFTVQTQAEADAAEQPPPNPRQADIDRVQGQLNAAEERLVEMRRRVLEEGDHPSRQRSIEALTNRTGLLKKQLDSLTKLGEQAAEQAPAAGEVETVTTSPQLSTVDSSTVQPAAPIGSGAEIPANIPENPIAPPATGTVSTVDTAPDGTETPSVPSSPLTAPAEVDAAAHAAATSPQNDLPEPTRDQALAGNYVKGHPTIAGLRVSIENPEGSTRSDKANDPPQWTTEIKGAHYGYVRGTEAPDGDQVDVFVKPATPRDYDGPVTVVDQVDQQTGKFDEPKAVIGAATPDEALAIYQANYPQGWKVGTATTVPMAEFKQWVREGDHKRPFAERASSAPPSTPPVADNTAATAAPGPQEAPARTYLAVPFTSKDFAKKSGAKWDADRKLWYAEHLPQFADRDGGINPSLQQFANVDEQQVYRDRKHAEVAALNLTARTGEPHEAREVQVHDDVKGWKAAPVNAAPATVPATEAPPAAEPAPAPKPPAEGVKVEKIAVGVWRASKDGMVGEGPNPLVARAALNRKLEGKPALEQKPKPPKKERAPEDKGRILLIRGLKGMGGITVKEAKDITGENALKANRLLPGLFRNGGKAMDLVAEWMHEYGYMTDEEYEDVDGGMQRARDIVRDLLDKRPIIRIQDMDDAAKRDLAAQLEEGYPEVDLSAAEIADLLDSNDDLTIEQVEASFDIAAAMDEAGITDEGAREAITERAALAADNGANYETVARAEIRRHQEARQGDRRETQGEEAAGPATEGGGSFARQVRALTEVASRHGWQVVGESAPERIVLKRPDGGNAMTREFRQIIAGRISGGNYHIEVSRGVTAPKRGVNALNLEGEATEYSGHRPLEWDGKRTFASNEVFAVLRDYIAANPGEALSSYTNAEVVAREEAAKKAAEAKAKADAEAEAKRKADAERDTFALSGSDRPADTLAAQGQGGLFDAPAATPARQPSRSDLITDAAEFVSELQGSRNPAKDVAEAYRRYRDNNAIGISRGEAVLDEAQFRDVFEQMATAKDAARKAEFKAMVERQKAERAEREQALAAMMERHGIAVADRKDGKHRIMLSENTREGGEKYRVTSFEIPAEGEPLPIGHREYKTIAEAATEFAPKDMLLLNDPRAALPPAPVMVEPQPPLQPFVPTDVQAKPAPGGMHTLKEGDRVRRTTGDRKGEEGTVTGLMPGYVLVKWDRYGLVGVPLDTGAKDIELVRPEKPAAPKSAAPEGYKPAGEPYYKDGKLTQGYAEFAPGERVRHKENGAIGTVESYVGAGPIFSRYLVNFPLGNQAIDRQYIEAAPAASSPEKQKALDDLKSALGDLGDLLGDITGARKKITPEQEQKLLPILTRAFDAAFRAGYYTFRDAARAVLQAIREQLGEPVADILTLDHLQGAYIAMAGRYRDQGADRPKDVLGVESKSELDAPKEATNAAGSGPVLEQDGGTGAPQPVWGTVLPADAGGAEPSAPAGAQPAGEGGSRPRGGQRVPGAGPADRGAGSDRAPGAEQPSDSGGAAASDVDSGSSAPGDLFGSSEPDTGEGSARDAGAAALDEEGRLAAQRAAERTPVKVGDRGNIAATLPYLHTGQQDDVAFAEARLSKPTGYGVLFTNGTGTGKTFTGLGIVKRYARQGILDQLIVVPNDTLMRDWAERGKRLGLTITPLADTKDAGKGIVVTTYANFGQNAALGSREFKVFVLDEAQNLSANENGDLTLAAQALRGLAMRADWSFQSMRLREPQLTAELEAAGEAAKAEKSGVGPLSDRVRKLSDEWHKKREALAAKYAAMAPEDRPRAVFLSATPFAYQKSIEWGQGWLWDWNEGADMSRQGAYNAPSEREQFFIRHFGYRMRYGKLTQPDSAVQNAVMEVEFNSWLKREGVLSGRILDVDHDYSRRFVMAEDAIGTKIDEGLKWMRDQRLDELYSYTLKQFDYLHRAYLLEALKARHAVKMAKEHMALGRKVVVFHDFNKGGGFHPFQYAGGRPGKLGQQIAQFNAQRADLAALDFSGLVSPIERFRRELPDTLFFNGTVSKGERARNLAKFNDDTSGPQTMLIQADAGGAGVSAHDTTGKYQRVLINLGMPVKPVASVQQEGRIYRVGQRSDAPFIYLNTGTSWERTAFAFKIAERAGTAENLAMGELARRLRESFIEAFDEAVQDYAPAADEGKGGKERDRRVESLSPFTRAKTFYFGQEKKNARTKAREGKDYFATPEPLGLKMVEWAGLRTGEKALEPSAGHGAIARWLPETVDRTIIEPSMELASRAALAAPGAQVINDTFENHHVGANKYDAIVMNPPFGTAGRTAVDHIAKAFEHLRDRGRLVAILPEGAALEKFDRWYHGDDAKGATLVARIRLPGVTFGRAGTGVGTQVVVIDRYFDPKDVPNVMTRDRDYSSVEDINELFDKVEFLELPDRPEPKPEAEATPPADDGKRHQPNSVSALRELLPDGAPDTVLGAIDQAREGFVEAAFSMTGGRTGKKWTWESETLKFPGPAIAATKHWAEQHATRAQRDGSRVEYTIPLKDNRDNARSHKIKLIVNPTRMTLARWIYEYDEKVEQAAPTGTVAQAQPPAAPSGMFEKAQTRHSRTGEDLYVAKVVRRVERDVYDRINAIAKSKGGWYSSFKGMGAIPGFQFKSEAAREEFIAAVNESGIGDPGVQLYSLVRGTAGDRLAARLRQIADMDNPAAALRDLPPSPAPKVDRGADSARQQLEAAKRDGKLTDPQADLALWLIDQNPAIADDLLVAMVPSGKEGVAGSYNPVNRIAVLIEGRSPGDGTLVAHEILHHAERMMPQDVQDGIRDAWARDLADFEAWAQQTGNEDARRAVGLALRMNAGDGSAQGELMRMFRDESPPDRFYALTNPSEYWAENGSRILAGRHAASEAGWVARARQWLAEFIAKVKDLFGLASDAAVIRGLNEVLRGDARFVSSRMLHEDDRNRGMRASRDGVYPALARGSRASWDAPEPSKIENLIYALQDKQIDLKRVVDAITAAGKRIADEHNPYLQETLYHGRAAKKVQDFIDRELNPLIRDMATRGIAMDDFEEYLHNRHAEERNIQIAKVNPDMPDGGSGIDTADARAYLAGLPAAKRFAYDTLAKKVDAIIAGTRGELVKMDLESPETIAAWTGAYEHYVPLMRDEMGEQGPGTGMGFSVRGPASKRAVGSKRDVVDILANIAMQRERAIVRGEKAVVSRALLNLAAANPNKDFWYIDKPRTIKDVDKRSGLVTEYTDPLWKSRDNVVVTRIAGPKGIEEHAVVFNERDPRAARMAASLKNLDLDDLGIVVGSIAKATRYLASVNTQYNPVFGVVNLIRDTQFAMLSLSATPIAGKELQVAKNVLSALKGIYLDVRAERAGGQASSPWAATFEEFQKEGGQTGYRDMFATSAERNKALLDELAKAKEGQVKHVTRAVFNWLSDYNAAMENAVRVSAYKVAVDSGMSKQQAAAMAKNLTVNFNRKGQMGAQAGALYAFFNASVQGTARLGQVLAGPKGRQIIAGGFAVGVLQALALAWAGFDDDEEPPEFVRERNLVIPIGDKRYISIPMPLGFHVIPNLGRITAEFALSGFTDPLKRIAQIGSVFAESFNPVGSGTLMQVITPTLIDPAVALAENKDWTGTPIYREAFGDDAKPGVARMKDTATLPAQWIAMAANWLTGGSEYRAGLFSPVPDQIDYLFGQVTGGVGRELGKAAQLGQTAVTGEELPTYKIPLLGRLYGNADAQHAQASRFYSTLKVMARHEAEIKGRARGGGDVRAYLAEHPEARLWVAANKYERGVSELKRTRREMVKRGQDVRMLDVRIAENMARFNDLVRRLRV